MNIIIGMGSNQDYRGRNPIEILDYAKEKMCKVRIDIIHESEYFTSPAYPNDSDPIFINSVLLAEYSGTPEELLFELQGIENYFGRVREKRWGKRSCDLDILAINDLVLPSISEFYYWANLKVKEQAIKTPKQLVVPHPRMQDRGFVLKPLMSIFSNWQHPVFEKTVAQMLNSLPEEEKEFVLQVK